MADMYYVKVNLSLNQYEQELGKTSSCNSRQLFRSFFFFFSHSTSFNTPVFIIKFVADRSSQILRKTAFCTRACTIANGSSAYFRLILYRWDSLTPLNWALVHHMLAPSTLVTNPAIMENWVSFGRKEGHMQMFKSQQSRVRAKQEHCEWKTEILQTAPTMRVWTIKEH